VAGYCGMACGGWQVAELEAAESYGYALGAWLLQHSCSIWDEEAHPFASGDLRLGLLHHHRGSTIKY
jgi:hypothetical protein